MRTQFTFPGALALAAVLLAGSPDPVALAAAPAQAFRWPLPGEPRVTRRFDPPPEPWLPGHRGVDLAAGPGSPVLAAGSGRVSFAGSVAGRGVVSVTHTDGLRTTYEPVTPSVSSGATVAPGDAIGALAPGHPGCPAAACLHWGARRGETYLDPLLLLGLGRVRLKPLHAVATAPASAVRPAAAAAPRRADRRPPTSRRRARRRAAVRRRPTG